MPIFSGTDRKQQKVACSAVDNLIFLTNCFFEKVTKIKQYCGPHLNEGTISITDRLFNAKTISRNINVRVGFTALVVIPTYSLNLI